MGFDTVAYKEQIDIFRRNLLPCDLALINRARGLYGRILTEVVSTDQTQ